jgi:hypothetical protein
VSLLDPFAALRYANRKPIQARCLFVVSASGTFSSQIGLSLSRREKLHCRLMCRPAVLCQTKKEDQMENPILEAIANKRLIQFQYNNLLRIAEPHVYGVTNGVKQILGYQMGGQSSNGNLPDWRRFDLTQIFQLTIISEPFPGRRLIPSGKHSSWDLRLSIVN